MSPLETHFDTAVDILNPPQLFNSQQEALNELLSVVHSVFQELKAEGVRLPSTKQYLHDVTEMMVLYRRFAPPEY